MSEPTLQLPSELKYGYVEAQIILAVADTDADPDRLPDATPASGTITLTPVESKRLYTQSGSPVLVGKHSISGSLDTQGRLRDSQGGLGLCVVVGQYNVTYSLQGVSVDPHPILVTEDHVETNPLNLVDLVAFDPPATPGQFELLNAKIDSVVNVASLFVRPVEIPVGVPDLPLTIYRDATDGSYSHDFDPSPYREGESHYWVVAGASSGGDGSESNPWDRFMPSGGQADVVNADTAESVVIHVDGEFARNYFSTAGLVADGRRLSIIGEGEGANVWAANVNLFWSETSAGSGTWAASRSQVQCVYDRTQQQEGGFSKRLEPAADLASCEAEPGSWWTDNTTVYVHREDEAKPDYSTTMLGMATTTLDIELRNGGTLYLENVHRFADGAARVTGDGTDTLFVQKDCTMLGGRHINPGASGNGLSVVDVRRTISVGCIIVDSTRDGFNYHYPSVYKDPAPAQPRDFVAVELDCAAWDCGMYSSASNNNTTTQHEAAVVVRVNSYGARSNGPAPCTDANGCLSVFYGCEFDSTGSNGAAIFLSDSAGPPLDGESWLYDTQTGGPVAHSDLRTVGSGHRAHLFNFGGTRLVLEGAVHYVGSP